MVRIDILQAKKASIVMVEAFLNRRSGKNKRFSDQTDPFYD